MAPRLELTLRSGQQSAIPLGDAALVFGRHPGCDVVLESDAVSRRHAQVASRGGDYVIEDLGSRNGTTVNGVLVEGATPLRHGDLVEMCDVEMRYHDGATARPDAAAMHVTLSDTVARGDIVSAMPLSAKGRGDCRVDPNAALHAVLDVARELTEGLEVDTLLRRVLDHVFEVYPNADRGVILMLDEADELQPRAAKARQGGDAELRISRTVVARAMERREAILSEDAAVDEQFDSSRSLMRLPIRSLMCVPLLSGDGRPLGVIQLHSEAERPPFTQGCLEVLASVAGMAAVAVENARLHRRLLTQDRLQRDFRHAREVQRSFLPRALPEVEGYRFFAHYEAADTIGGDYYGLHPLANGKVAIGVGDVSGKGLPAALLMARLASDVRYALAQADDPAVALSLVHRALSTSGPEDRFVTFALLVLDPRAHEIAFANAGHPPPLLRRADGCVVPLRPSRLGVPLNVSDDPELQPGCGVVELAPGEVVLLYSDGLSEAADSTGEQFGEARIAEVLAAAGAETGERLMARVGAFTAGLAPRDDTTVVTLARES
ncbi:MAG: SpoIIE family protein phosphatase [Planctomycetota bacterium]